MSKEFTLSGPGRGSPHISQPASPEGAHIAGKVYIGNPAAALQAAS